MKQTADIERELRCRNCNKLLLRYTRGRGALVDIKCPRCKVRFIILLLVVFMLALTSGCVGKIPAPPPVNVPTNPGDGPPWSPPPGVMLADRVDNDRNIGIKKP